MDDSSLSSSLLQQLAMKFGVVMKSSKKLHGYGDVTFRITGFRQTSEQGFGAQNPPLQKYVMKIQKENTMCSNDEMVQVIDYLRNEGFGVPCLLRTSSGAAMPMCPEGLGMVGGRPVKMYEFIEGETIINSTLTDRGLLIVSRNVGFLGGLLTKCLQEMPFAPEATFEIDPKHVDSVWVIQHAQKLRQHLYCVEDDELETIVEGFLDLHKDMIENDLAGLRRGFMQGDFSDSNIIVKEFESAATKEITSPDEAKRSFGIIDFQHCHFGWIAFEVAITIAYMMTSCEGSDAEPNAVAREILAGYQTVVPLTDREKGALYCCVGMRLAVSYVEKYHRRESNPGRREDLSFHASKCPRLLKKLWKDGQTETTKQWFPC